MFDAAIDSARPEHVLSAALPDLPRGRVVVVGAGKASAAMAAALEAAWPDVALEGAVVTRYGHAVPTRRVRVIEAAHPVPDANSVRAARVMLDLVRDLTADDLVIALMSGGGSALMSLPVEGLSIEDKAETNRVLLASGASISVMNQVRRRLSAVKGGKLARAAHPARVVTLAISDVPGDDPATIASGPTVPDPSSQTDLAGVVARLGDRLPAAARRILCAPPAPVPRFDADVRLIATPRLALEAAARVARQAGVTPLILGDALEGEAAQMGIMMAGIARSCVLHNVPVPRPAVLLSGGETTVTLGTAPTGRGGRNTEFLLSLALSLEALPGVHAIAGDTDGIDGSDDAAGALIAPDSLARAAALDLAPRDLLDRHDALTLFDALGDAVRTGPTLTNVNDFRAVLIL
nr:glycerate kinase [Falsirhodobacter halotolerans]